MCFLGLLVENGGGFLGPAADLALVAAGVWRGCVDVTLKGWRRTEGREVGREGVGVGRSFKG